MITYTKITEKIVADRKIKVGPFETTAKLLSIM